MPFAMEVAHAVTRGPQMYRGVFLSGREFRRLTGPVVYAWYRGDDVQYIGVSKHGLRRLVGQDHQVIKGIDPRHDWFFIWPCQTIEKAEKLERRLIRRMRPPLNKLWNPDDPKWSRGLGRPKKALVPIKRRKIPHFRSAYWAQRPRPKVTA